MTYATPMSFLMAPMSSQGTLPPGLLHPLPDRGVQRDTDIVLKK